MMWTWSLGINRQKL